MHHKTLIAVFLPSLRGGGTERAMMTLANSFASRGFQVDLVLASAEGPYLSEVSSSVTIVDLRQSRMIRSLPGLVGYLKQRKPDAVLSALGHSNLVVLLAKKVARIKTRVVVSEREDPTVKDISSHGFRSKIVASLNRYLYQSADAVHAVSFGVSHAVAKKYCLPKASVHVVYNPIDSSQIRRLSQEKIPVKLRHKNSNYLIVSAGRLSKEKDFPCLIHAFCLMRKKINAHLMIIGEGGLRSNLERLIIDSGLEKFVTLPGFVSNPFPLMRKADLFVLSSAWEGLPNVLLQAMACGTPVVSTNCPSGPSEILEDGRWGRLVPVGDAIALAEAMLETLMAEEHPDVVKRAKFFNPDRAVEGYLDLLLPKFSSVK